MVLLFERFGFLSLDLLIFMFLTFLGVVFENIFFIKRTPILYLPLIIVIFFSRRRQSPYYLNILIFILGLAEDVLSSRILGVTSIFCLVFFIILNKIVSNFIRDLAKCIITIIGLILYTFYEIISLFYLQDQHPDRYLINLQIISFICTSVIIAFIYFMTKNSEKRLSRTI